MFHQLFFDMLDNSIGCIFNDNKEGIVDLSDLIIEAKGMPFRELQNQEVFKKFTVDYTIIWSDELDITPEFLYFKTFEYDKNLQQQFQKWGYVA
jgi:hypothetical protein